MTGIGLLFDPFERWRCILQACVSSQVSFGLRLTPTSTFVFVRFRLDSIHDATPPTPTVNTMNYVVVEN